MRDGYAKWLLDQGYAGNTASSQQSWVRKVEQAYGSLDDLKLSGGIDELIREMTYSSDDERRNRANPTRIPIEGNVRNGLASYKASVVLYRRFLDEAGPPPSNITLMGDVVALAEVVVAQGSSDEKQRLSLERDMQTALRRNITQLEQGLKIIDGGAERFVASGFIDILCEDDQGRLVVVELKAGKSDPRVVGQTLGYMGDLIEEDAVQSVRGIIVAHEFDQRTKSAARAVPNLSLMRYAVSFTFSPEF